MYSNFNLYTKSLNHLPPGKIRINTLNAHSYNVVLKNKIFKEAILSSHVLLPDGVSIVFAEAFINHRKIKKIPGEEIFKFEMKRLNSINGTCFFLGSNNNVLTSIVERASLEYPNVKVETHSPPFKKFFSKKENDKIIKKINLIKPDVLFVGMTAPKQEIWSYQNFDKIKTQRIIAIGAVFDFYAGTVSRSPQWLINLGLEWFFRMIKEPKRLWKRYLIGNLSFVLNIFKEKIKYLKKGK